MAARVFDLSSYNNLLIEAHPTVPQTEKENERLLSLAEDLLERAELSPEESALLEVLLVLIEKFEHVHYSLKRATPHETLREMMRAHGVSQKDLYGLFGSKGTTSEVLRGKRAISKSAAKALAARFNVSTDRFL